MRITTSRGESRSTCESRGTRHIISETCVLSPFLGHMSGANHVSHFTLSYRPLRPNKKEEVLISFAAHLIFYETRKLNESKWGKLPPKAFCEADVFGVSCSERRVNG